MKFLLSVMLLTSSLTFAQTTELDSLPKEVFEDQEILAEMQKALSISAKIMQESPNANEMDARTNVYSEQPNCEQEVITITYFEGNHLHCSLEIMIDLGVAELTRPFLCIIDGDDKEDESKWFSPISN